MECVNLRSAAVLNININKYSNLKKKFITDLAINILDSFSSLKIQEIQPRPRSVSASR